MLFMNRFTFYGLPRLLPVTNNSDCHNLIIPLYSMLSGYNNSNSAANMFCRDSTCLHMSGTPSLGFFGQLKLELELELELKSVFIFRFRCTIVIEFSTLHVATFTPHTHTHTHPALPFPTSASLSFSPSLSLSFSCFHFQLSLSPQLFWFCARFNDLPLPTLIRYICCCWGVLLMLQLLGNTLVPRAPCPVP